MMASPSSIPARSFYRRSNIHTVIPGSSADSDGSDSGNEDLSTLPPRADAAASDDDDYLPPGGNILTEDDVASSSSSDDEPAPRQGTSTGNRQETSIPVFKWRKVEQDVSGIEKDITFSEPDEVGTAMQYFKRLFDASIIQMIVDQTNLYSVQETGHSVNTTCNEMNVFISMLIYTGLVKTSAFIDFWAQGTRFAPIADAMPLKRFQKLQRYIHFNDNTMARNSDDRFFKIRPVMDMVRRNFLAIEHEEQFSIDEMMVPYEGTKGRQPTPVYSQQTPQVGFKLFTRAGVSGIVYDFIANAGKSTFRPDDFTDAEMKLGQGAQVVLTLCRSIPDPRNSKVYFDNFFTSFELISHLRSAEIYAIGTMRQNRLRNVEMKNDKVLGKEPRGSYDYRTDAAAGITVVKWRDNKVVTLASSFVGVHPLTTMKRYDKVAKSKVDVTAPNIVRQYNVHMGGVDLADMLIALYRTPLKAKRWHLVMFGQMLDMCVCNAWLLYRRDVKLLDQGQHVPLGKFRRDIAFALHHACQAKRGRPPLEDAESAAKIHRFVAPRPVDDKRYDGIGHWPVHDKKGRCRLCRKGWSRMKCSKCDTMLCFTGDKNCFVAFHNK